MVQQQRGIISGVFVPPAPKSVADTGLNMGLLSDLTLKSLYFESYLAGRDLADRMGLPFAGVVSGILDFLKREQLCEVRSASGRGGLSEAMYEYVRAGARTPAMRWSARSIPGLHRFRWLITSSRFACKA